MNIKLQISLELHQPEIQLRVYTGGIVISNTE